MRAFTFENATKIYFGGGCVKEHLLEAVKPYGETVMLAYGGGSIKTNGIYQEVMDVLKLAGPHPPSGGGGGDRLCAESSDRAVDV